MERGEKWMLVAPSCSWGEHKFEFTGSETSKAEEIWMWSGSETALRDRIHSPPPPLISLSLFISPPFLWALPSWNNCKSHWEKDPKNSSSAGAPVTSACAWSKVLRRFLIGEPHLEPFCFPHHSAACTLRVVLWVFFLFFFIFFPFAPWKESVQNVAQTGRPYQRLSRWAGAAGNQR